MPSVEVSAEQAIEVAPKAIKMDRHDAALQSQLCTTERLSVDPQTLKELSSLSRQQEHVRVKLVRVENSLAATRSNNQLADRTSAKGSMH